MGCSRLCTTAPRQVGRQRPCRHVCLRPAVRPSTCLTVRPLVHLSVCLLFVSLFLCPSVCPSFCPCCSACADPMWVLCANLCASGLTYVGTSCHTLDLWVDLLRVLRANLCGFAPTFGPIGRPCDTLADASGFKCVCVSMCVCAGPPACPSSIVHRSVHNSVFVRTISLCGCLSLPGWRLSMCVLSCADDWSSRGSKRQEAEIRHHP